MFQTLQLVNAAVARVQQTLPATAQITVNRLTFATLDPISGYALTSTTISPTRLWELATYELKPPLIASMASPPSPSQGGQVPEFHVIPNTGKLISASLTISDLVNAIQQTNLVQSPGLYEANHQLILSLVGDQASNIDQLAAISVKATPAGVPSTSPMSPRSSPLPSPSIPSLLQTASPLSCSTSSSSPMPTPSPSPMKSARPSRSSAANLPAGGHHYPLLRPVHFVRDSIASVRDAILIGLILAAIIIVLFLRDWTSSLVAGLVIPVTIAVTFIRALGHRPELQPHDPRRTRCRRRPRYR